MRLNDRLLRRESERWQQVADGTWSNRDAEDFFDKVGDNFRSPSFSRIAVGESTIENHLLELLLLFIGEFAMSSRSLFTDEAAKIISIFSELLSPLLDGGGSHFDDIGDSFVVIAFENHFASPKTSVGLRR